MSPATLIPVVLSGGSGTRLWPVSRRATPKQLQRLAADRTMLEATLDRVTGIPDLGPPIVVCARAHHDLVASQIDDPDGLIITEPVGRNTAPAAAAAALASRRGGSDPLLLVLPADHVIADADAFRSAVAVAAHHAADGALVTFGVLPTRPETGYGYIRGGEALDSGVRRVEAFVEKPDEATAQRYVSGGDHWWNSGMFVFRASRYLDELERYAPDMVAAVAAAVDKGEHQAAALHLAEDPFAACPADSIDYSVMERTRDAVVVALDAGWSDVGSWAALFELADATPDGNVVRGDVVALDASGNYLRAEHRLLAVAEVSDLVVVETTDAVLVVPLAATQRVKDIVAELQGMSRPEVEQPAVTTSASGRVNRIDQGPGFEVTRRELRSGGQLSLQSAADAAEVWVVAAGSARVTMDGSAFRLPPGGTLTVPPAGDVQVANEGTDTLVVICVRHGDAAAPTVGDAGQSEERS